MPKAMSWRSSPKSIILSCLIIFSIGLNTVECQEEGAERPKAFAAPTGLNALDIDGTDKAFFKIGPTRDGITRAIADEVSPRIKLEFPPNSPNDSPAYDDNLVEATGEEDLFIPSIYRNETEKEKEEKKTTTTTRAPQTTTQRRVTFGREPLAPTFNTPRPSVPQPPVRLPPAVQTFEIGPTRDGITRAIADEVSPRIKLEFPPNSPNDSPAYDDNLVEATGEEDLFIPSIYRNETEKEKEEKKTTTTTRAPQTTTQRRVTFGREPLAPTFNTPRPPVPQPPVRLPPAVQTFGGPQPPPRVPLPPAPQQTRTPPPVFQTRPPPPPVPQPTRPPPPPPVFQTLLPQTRPPPPAPVFQTRPPQTLPPAPAPTRPPFQQQPQPLPGFRPLLPIQRPLQPQTLPAFQQPAQPFIPQLRPAQQTRPPPPPTTPRPVFTQPPPPPPQQPQQQQPFRPRPRPAIQPIAQQPQQPTPAPRPLRPFRPAGGRPFRPRPRPQDPTGLRTGFCPFTIFYQSGPAAAFEAQQTYTHFASVVSVDQCARTCHEFKCDAAFFDSANRHCQFNPGQGSNAPPPSCPTYPSPFLRNNVPLSAVPLKI
uniref:Apple domain-containing protein n=1 Tax=Panagrolaimus sp. ES5 TaxID=591445 RepID=A0AC34FVT1_9BILA